MAKKQEKKPKNKKIKSPKFDNKVIVETVLPPIPVSQDIPVYDVFEDYDKTLILGSANAYMI